MFFIGQRQIQIGWWVFWLGMVAGCAGPKLAPVEKGTEFPQDLPQELKEKFEVKGGDPKPMPAEEPEAAAAPGKEKKPAKAKASPKDEAPKSALVYPDRRSNFTPIWPHEKLVLDITYLGMVAGTFTVEVLPNKKINGRRVYHIFGHAVSSRFFSLFYRLDDTIESFWDFEGLFSHRFHLKLNETKQTRNALELYDSEKDQTFYWNRWNHVEKGYHDKKEFFPMTADFPQDSLSTLYYVRTLPLEIGKKYSFPVVSEGKTWEAVVTAVSKEKIEGPDGWTDAIKLKPDMKFQGVLQKKGDIFLWVSDDARRYPLRLEAKVKIGRVVAVLKEIFPGQQPQ